MTAQTGTAPYFTDVTGPIDFYDESDPYVQQLIADDVVVDRNGAHHGQGGRFVPKLVEYAHIRDHTLDWDPDAVPSAEEPVVRVDVSAYKVYAPKCPHNRFRCCPKGCH